MFKYTAGYKEKRRLEAANNSQSVTNNSHPVTNNSQPAADNSKKPKRSFSTTKAQVLKKGFKEADNNAMKERNESNESNNAPTEGQPNLLPAPHGNDDCWSPGPDYDDFEPSVSFTNTLPRQARPRANRKDLWAKQSRDLKVWYRESFELHGHADPCLKQPNNLTDEYKCDCNSKKTNEVYCYMLHSHVRINVEHCDHHSLFKKLVLMQMFPSSTITPKSAMHFAVFEKLMSLKLNGYISNYAFVKTQNADNLLLCNYGMNGFKNLNHGLFNTLQVIYRNLKSHALDELQLFQEELYCHACVGAERVGIVLDGNFQLKRKKNTKIREEKQYRPSIFAESLNIQQLWENEGEVEQFANEKEDYKEEMCGLEELDNAPSFKATAENRKVSNRFDEEGVFSMNCARHGVPIRLYDIYNGEGRKYALASVSHIMSTLKDSQQLLIMYDIVCLCKNKFEACIPGLKDKDPRYLVTVFHAYAHSMHCQVRFHPKVVDGSGNTDGEGVERFWSTANKFIAMIRQMSKFNRKALLADVTHYFKQSKMLELPGQISTKFDKALKKVNELNMTNEEYLEMEKQWNEHVNIVMIPATPSGVKMLIDRAERSSTTARDSYYYSLNIDLLWLDNLEDANGNRIEITQGMNLQNKNFLASQIEQMQTKYGYPAISSLEDPLLQQHCKQLVEIRYRVMNDFIKHLLFAILMKEHNISLPGSLGTAKAAKIIISLDALKKKAEVIIGMINDFVDKNYNTEEEKKGKRRETVGREVEKIRKYAAENGLDLPTPLNNWHILKRNVEEIDILVGEAKRVLENYGKELQSLCQKDSSHFVKLRILDVNRRLSIAKALLSRVARATPPALVVSRESGDLGKKVVVFFEDRGATDDHVYVDNEEGEVDDDSANDVVDLAEGGEPNPEEEALLTFGDLIQESTSNH